MDKKLIIFGLSRVLLDSELGGFGDILTILGKDKIAKEIEKEYQKRKIFGPWIEGMEMYTQEFKGFSKKDLERVALKYCKESLRRGTIEALIKLKKQGHLLGVLSSNPQFVIDSLSKVLPLDFWEGTQFEFKEGKVTGKIKRRIDRYVKIGLLKEKRKILGFEKEKVIIISDPVSVTDFPMAKEAGFFVGFDPKRETLKEVIEALIKQENLKGIFKL